MTAQPTELRLAAPDVLRITWSDGQELDYPVRALREHCPCASCREKQREKEQDSSLLPVLSPAEAQPLRISSMKPIGNYAYGISFSDGHDTGIYTLEFLRQLGEYLNQQK